MAYVPLRADVAGSRHKHRRGTHRIAAILRLREVADTDGALARALVAHNIRTEAQLAAARYPELAAAGLTPEQCYRILTWDYVPPPPHAVSAILL